MNAVKVTLRTAAFLIGAGASCGAGVGAYLEFYGGPMAVAPLLLIAILMAAGVLILISWRREFVRDPWVVLSAVFAVCVFFYVVTFPDHIGLYEFGPSGGTPWLTVSLKVLGYMAFAVLSYVAAAFIYHGAHAFLLSLFHALTRKPRKHSSIAGPK